MKKSDLRKLIREEIDNILEEEDKPEDWGSKRNDKYIEKQLNFIFGEAFQGFVDKERQVVYRNKTVVVPAQTDVIIKSVITRISTQPAGTANSLVGVMSYQGQPALLFSRTR